MHRAGTSSLAVLILATVACSPTETVDSSFLSAELPGSRSGLFSDAPGEEVTFSTTDGIVLEGRTFGNGNDWVILAHMKPADMTSWFDFARLLANIGYTALPFNFRGYGNSGGGGFAVETDVVAAIDFATTRGAARIAVIGASMGGTGALAAVAQRPVFSVGALSPPTQFEGVDALAALPLIHDASIFMAATEDDDGYAAAIEKLRAAAGSPRVSTWIAPGSEHGTDMFFGPEGELLVTSLLELLGTAEMS